MFSIAGLAYPRDVDPSARGCTMSSTNAAWFPGVPFMVNRDPLTSAGHLQSSVGGTIGVVPHTSESVRQPRIQPRSHPSADIVQRKMANFSVLGTDGTRSNAGSVLLQPGHGGYQTGAHLFKI